MTSPAGNPLSLLRFAPMLKAKVWGGRRLARWGKPLPTSANYGESWEIADLDSTDPGGGGGEAALSVVVGGAHAGRTLRDLLRAMPGQIMGEARLSPEGGFPLLVKFLDAREHLSVQVHPSPAYARTHPGAHLKTESWFVLEAERVGGVPPLIFKGLRPGVTPADLRRAIEAGRVPEVLHAEAAVPGECHTLPSGTVHALGAGVLVAEVQTASDTTFRVYDWAKEHQRTGRTLHVEQAMANILFEPAPAAVQESGSGAPVAQTDFYAIRVVRGGLALAAGRCAPTIVMGLDALRSGASGPGASGAEHVARGETVLIPATCAADLQFGRALVVDLRNL